MGKAGAKTAYLLMLSAEKLVTLFGLETIGFLTLTFKDHVLDAWEANRRLNSLLTHVIRPRYRGYVTVIERQASGRVHFHLLIACENDIQSGARVGEFRKKNYTSANPALRSEWAFWRRTAPLYGFGRVQLEPMASNAQAMVRYIGKYIGKHMETRKPEDKGVRLFRCSNNVRVGSSRFAWANGSARIWRKKLGLFAQIMRVDDLPQMKEKYGKKWAYWLRDSICSLDLPDILPPPSPVFPAT